METLKPQHKTKARKEHTCSFCNTIILKGEIYNNATFKNDRIYSWKSHLTCDEIVDKLKMHQNAIDSGYEGVDGEWFDETIKEEYNSITNTAYEPIPFMAKLKFVLTYYKII